MSAAERADVAVVGAGFAGLAVAALCADAGLRVVVLERRPRLAPEGVGLVHQPNGLAVLGRLGLVGKLLRAGQRIDDVRQLDGSARVRVAATYATLDHPHPYLVTVERTRSIALLAARAQAADLRCGATVTGLLREGDRVSGVRYSDASGEERVLHAACVVAADGRNSVVRGALGARLRWRTGPDRYLIGISSRPPTDPAALLYCGEGWADGVLPLQDRTYFFDHVVGASAEAVDRGDFDGWRRVFAGRVPEGEEIGATLRSFGDVGFLSGRTHRAVPRVRPGVALVGDAAAAVHPHNGQGANLALEDALALATRLVEHGPDSPAALTAYARERDAKSRLQVPWSIFIGRMFDGPNAGWRALRRCGYPVAQIPFVQREATRRQAGI